MTDIISSALMSTGFTSLTVLPAIYGVEFITKYQALKILKVLKITPAIKKASDSLINIKDSTYRSLLLIFGVKREQKSSADPYSV